MVNARNIALKVLYKIDKEKAYSNIVLDEALKENRDKINNADIGLVSEIVYGVTTWRLTLDSIIEKHSKIKLNKISTWIINILRMGIYQIIFLDKIPKSAAADEAVKLAKKYGHQGSVGYTNAILRKITKKDYDELFEIKNPTKKISKTRSMPEWLVEELIKQNGEKQADKICAAFTLRPKVTIRVNTLKTDAAKLKEMLKENKIEYKEIEETENFLIIDRVKNIENLGLFKEGYFTVQDLSAGLAAMSLNPMPNDTVLDACSSPGGKTTHMAELMENKGQIDAWDIHESRIKLVLQNAKRLGINIINAKPQDAMLLKTECIEKYDKILLDVPCLGIGVIKRKPDIKWQKKKEDIEEITKIQYEILSVCSKYLKKGGYLVYSTCSILNEENDKIIEGFLKENPDFSYDKKSMTILPNEIQDGFFICKLKKEH